MHLYAMNEINAAITMQTAFANVNVGSMRNEKYAVRGKCVWEREVSDL